MGFDFPLLRWPKTMTEAMAEQNRLRHQIVLRNGFHDPLRTIAGIDVGIDTRTEEVHAAIVVLEAETLTMIASSTAQIPTTFPYIPGFLSFREIPAIMLALRQLKMTPDLLMVDGQGVAHPKRLGIAAHLGVLLDHPTIGVAKSRLVGRHEDVGTAKGAHTPLWHGTERIGTVLRSRDHVRPLYVSPGHKVDHETAMMIVQACLTRYRLPEPTRLADKLSKVKTAQESLATH